MSSYDVEVNLDDALIALSAGRNRDPFAVLGPHPHESGRGLIIRTFQPSARAVDVRLGNSEWHAMTRRVPGGVFEVHVPTDVPDYRLRLTTETGDVRELDDPYRYGPVLTGYDLHLLGEGTHYRAFE